MTLKPNPATRPPAAGRRRRPAANLIAALLGAVLAVVVLLSVVEAVAHTMPLYRPALRASAALELTAPPADRLPASAATLEQVMARVLSYLRGRADDAQVMLPTAGDGAPGETIAGFTQDELLHLSDVRALFSAGLRTRNLLAFFMAGLALALGMTAPAKLRRHAAAALPWAGAWLTAFTFIVGLAAVADFDLAFDRFHELLFRNDLWLLPADSLLIKMLPGWLFARLAGVIGALALLIGGALVTTGRRLGRANRGIGVPGQAVSI